MALNQVAEPVPVATANSSQPNPNNNSNVSQTAPNQTPVPHLNPTQSNAATPNPTVINQAHPYQQQVPPPPPPQHNCTSMFGQSSATAHQQVMHSIPMQQNPTQQMIPHQAAQSHHMHLQQQSQAQGPHIQQQTIGNSVAAMQQQQQHPQVGTSQVPPPMQPGMVPNHASPMPGMHHQMVTNQAQTPHQQPPPSHMITPQNMMVPAPGQPTPQSSEYAYQNQIAHQGYQTVYAQGPQTMANIQQSQQPIDQQTNMYANQMNYPSPQQQQQQQYSIQQQQYQMQRPGSAPYPQPVQGQRLVNPSQIQSPNQMMMMNNRPATAVGVQMPQPGLCFYFFESLKFN